MIKEKKGKIAGVSYDKWLEEKHPKSVPKYKRKRYSNQAIAFLDVLGIKDFIDKHRDGNEYIAIDKMEQIRKIVESSVSIVKLDIDYLYISDSFVFVTEPDKVIALLELAAAIQIRIINECHFLLRGAITIGDAIIDNDGKQIIGPAYIQAFQLQEKDAIYPRIIVDNSVIKAIEKANKKTKDYLRQDADKEYFIDYIKVVKDIEPLKEQGIKISLRRHNVFANLIQCYQQHNEQEQHNICQKYGWTIQYYKNKGVWEDDYNNKSR